MTQNEAANVDSVSALLIQLGASAQTAPVMAAQLLKRAEPLAAGRQLSPVEAVEQLPRQVVGAPSHP